MDQRKTLVRDFEKEITVKEQDILKHLAELGEYLFENYKKDSRLKAQEDYDAAKRNLDQNAQFITMKERIGEITARLEDVRTEYAESVSLLENLERSNIPVYERIGIAAFRLFLEDPGQTASYRELFEEMEQQEQEIRTIDRDIDNFQIQDKEKKFFKRLADKGQATYLKGVKLVRQKGLPHLYQALGRKLVKTDFLEAVNSQDVAAAAKPFLQNREQLRELTVRRERLDEERTQLQNEISGLGVDKRPERRIAEIEENIEQNLQKTRKRMTNIALKVRQDMSDKMQEDQDIQNHLQRIQSAETKIGNYRENINKLEAAIEAENLARQIGRMKESIAEHERRIQDHKNEINELETRIKAAEKEKKRQEEIRGSEEIKLIS